MKIETKYIEEHQWEEMCTWEDCEPEMESYGHFVLKSHPFAETFGHRIEVLGQEIEDYNASFFTGDIPTRFVVRTYQENNFRGKISGYWGFECGLDLLEDGKIWINGKTFDTSKEALGYLSTNWPDYKIFVEEALKH